MDSQPISGDSQSQNGKMGDSVRTDTKLGTIEGKLQMSPFGILVSIEQKLQMLPFGTLVNIEQNPQMLPFGTLVSIEEKLSMSPLAE